MKYFYKDLMDGKQHFTRLPFTGWTEPTGLLRVPYAMFRGKSSITFIPIYSLSKETRAALPTPPKSEPEETPTEV